MKHQEYVKSQSGDTAVLMIHGILGTPRHFDPFLSLVPNEWSVYAILLDGHGATVGDFSKTSLKKWREQVDSTLSSLAEKYRRIIIIGHSMGTLLAIDAFEKYKGKICAMVFLASATRIFVKPYVAVNSLKVTFSDGNKDSEYMKATRNSCSVELDKRLWKYLGWIPRFIDLFKISAVARRKIEAVTAPVYVFQSGKDELVSCRSAKAFATCEVANVEILKNSYHYYYDGADFDYLRGRISEIFRDILNAN